MFKISFATLTVSRLEFHGTELLSARITAFSWGLTETSSFCQAVGESTQLASRAMRCQQGELAQHSIERI